MSKEKREEDTKMKMMKKVAISILAVCLMLPCFSLVSNAANDGKIMFTDHKSPAVETGSTVEVKGVVQKSKGNFGKIDITMTFDSSMLSFQSGDGITKLSDGKIQYIGDATNDVGARKEFFMKFKALKAGTAVIKIESATIKSVAGDVLDYQKGSSTILITGEPVESGSATATSMEEEINGVVYYVAEEVPENEIPEGYEEEILLDKYNAVYNETKNLYLVYMINEDNVGQLFMFDEQNATFYPYEEIKISEEASIVLLGNISNAVLPEKYQKTEVSTLSGNTFPAWQSDDTPGFCLVYALNDQGQRMFYQMDIEENTYQRFFVQTEQTGQETDGWFGKFNAFLQEHLDYFILGAGLGLLLFVVIIIVLSVKLYNRNAELDEIYEEYGINSEDEIEEDLVLELNEEEDEEYEDDDYELGSDLSTNLYLQEGMKELFPEEAVSEEPVPEVEPKKAKIDVEPIVKNIEPVVKPAEELEDSLGAVFAQQKAEDDDETFFDDETFDNFSLDFIDLDD